MFQRLMMLALVLVGLALPAKAAFAQGCTFDLADATFDFAPEFARDAPVERFLGTRTTQLTVTCAGPSDMTMQLDATPHALAAFWQLDTAGRYSVHVSNVLLDGAAAQLASGTAGSAVDSVADTQLFANGKVLQPAVGGVPVHGTTLTATVQVQAWLDPMAQVASATTWTAPGQIELTQLAKSRAIAVEASVTPGACTVSLSNGVINLGQIPVATLNAATPTTLADRTLTMNVACSASGVFATLATENRPGTAYLIDGTPQTAARSFGLGRTTRGAPIGAYQIRVDQATADGNQVAPIMGSNASGWTAPSPFFLESSPGNTYSVGGITTGPIAATNASWSLRVTPVIAPQGTLQVTGAETIDGSMTLTIVYP